MALRGVKEYGSVEKLNRTRQPRLAHWLGCEQPMRESALELTI
jgi:hypothetical protein